MALLLRKLYPLWTLHGLGRVRSVFAVYHYDVASGSEITPCNKIDKPLFLHGNSLREAV